ncbi:mechanosensitive ion channel family protein [bacterium]|nr:mechanosensitive ion channel family protein [bacterium]
MNDFLVKYVDKLISIIAVFIVVFVVNKIIDKIIEKTIIRRRKKNLTTLLVFIKRIKKLVLYSLAILIAIGEFDTFNTFSKTLLSGLGIGSVVLGLAAQESLKNFFGSIAIVLGNAYDVGDFIECVDKGVSGTVEDISMRHTVIRTINNRRVLIPNSEMNTYTIENFNYADNENVKLVDFTISYESDVDKAMDILKEEVGKMYHPSPKGRNKNVEFPKVRISSWNDSSISLRAWVWGKDNDDVFENTYNLRYIIKKRFDDEGIEIPYPHLVTINKNKE